MASSYLCIYKDTRARKALAGKSLKLAPSINSEGQRITGRDTISFDLTRFANERDNSLKDELREAARIDGAGEYRAFAQVMLPLVKPTIAATATVQFLDAWNSYLDPLVFISNWKKWTIPLALNQFVGTEVTQYNLTMAACCMAVVPVFIVFLFGQKFFLKGLSVGAVKG